MCSRRQQKQTLDEMKRPKKLLGMVDRPEETKDHKMNRMREIKFIQFR